MNGLGVGFLGLQPLIMTLAMATFLQGLLIIIAGGSAISVTNATLEWLGSAHPLTIPASILLWLAVAAVASTGCTARAAARGFSRSAPIRW